MRDMRIINLFCVGLITLLCGVSYLAGTCVSKPMYVLETWRKAYRDQKLETLRCQDQLKDMEIKYRESQ